MKILSVSFIVVILDQLSKYWAKSNFFDQPPTNVIGDFLRISFCENPGIAFGIKVGGFLSLITLLSVFATVLIFYYLFSERNNSIILKSSLALILGGAIGNLIDRSMVIFSSDTYSGVIDFIDIGIGHYRWYIFNVADMAVTCGIILFAFHSFFPKSQTNKTA
ncbi:MAG: signal peptidase II [Candidatus Marinimicrobia bacterium]|nr:signal peptidase II [Candidatus Neomarinimicrobiota bacterium]MBL7023227.1 signal peptidase II [Candidatus Neomarinimicrobiota bacterium]MBL7110305.1 signal peptidase II [Candidatus Neomarinimicrobiota bacterium]